MMNGMDDDESSRTERIEYERKAKCWDGNGAITVMHQKRKKHYFLNFLHNMSRNQINIFLFVTICTLNHK